MKAIERSKLIDIPVFDLGDIYLRAIEYSDYPDLFEYGSDPRVTKTLTWTMDTLEDAKKAVKMVHLSRPDKNIPLPYAIIHKETEKMIGTCDYHTIDWNTATGEIGYVINYDYWGKGYMTKACKALIYFGFRYLRLATVVISHDILNHRSQRVIEKSGFILTEEKIHEKTQSMNKYYRITREEYDKNHI